MNKKGFVFVETIIAVVILTSSLLLLYSTFTNILQSEKTRIYYDDINYVYRTYFLKRVMFNGNVHNGLPDDFFQSNVYAKHIGIDNIDFDDKDKEFFRQMLEDFEVRNLYIVKTNSLSKLKACTEKCAYKGECSIEDANMQENCSTLYLHSSSEIVKYFKSIYYVGKANYLLLAEYESCDKNNLCRNYYSWISVVNI